MSNMFGFSLGFQKVTMTFHSLLEKNCETFETIHEHMKRACQTLKQCLLRQCPFLFCLMLTFFLPQQSFIFLFHSCTCHKSIQHKIVSFSAFLHLLAMMSDDSNLLLDKPNSFCDIFSVGKSPLSDIKRK